MVGLQPLYNYPIRANGHFSKVGDSKMHVLGSKDIRSPNFKMLLQLRKRGPDATILRHLTTLAIGRIAPRDRCGMPNRSTIYYIVDLAAGFQSSTHYTTSFLVQYQPTNCLYPYCIVRQYVAQSQGSLPSPLSLWLWESGFSHRRRGARGPTVLSCDSRFRCS